MFRKYSSFSENPIFWWNYLGRNSASQIAYEMCGWWRLRGTEGLSGKNMFKCLPNKFMIQDSFWKRPKNYEKDASDLCLEDSNEIISVCKANTDRLQIANEGI